MNKYLYKIKDLEVPPWLKYWFARKSKVNFDLSEILKGTSFDLTNTVNKKLHLINIFGNSVQETTTGKNLLNPTRSDATASGVSISYDAETQILTLNGECTQDNLTFSLPNNSIHAENGDTIYLLVKYISGTSNGYFSFRCFNSDFSALRHITVSDPIIQDLSYSSLITSNIDFTKISIRVDNGSTFNNFKFKLMVSTVDAVYEPYTDGASPNPIYPQEIYSAGDNGSIVEKITNKNLFNKGNINSFNTYVGIVSHAISTNVNEKFRTIYVKLINGKTYTVSKGFGGILILGTTEDVPTLGMTLNKFSNFSNLTDGKYGTITLSGNDKYLVAYIYSSADYDRGLDIQEIYDTLQIEENTVATTYLEHQEQLYTIPCQQPMRAIGDVKDTFVKIDGVWYERHNIGEFILNGSENWNRTETKTSGNYYFFCDNVLNNILYTNNKFAGISNIGITTSVYQEIQGVDTIYYDSKNRTRIYTETTKAMTVEEFKNWLSLNNVKLIYDLLISTDLPCTQAQITVLESLSKARTYKNITHIYSEDEVPAELEIQYYKEKGE